MKNYLQTLKPEIQEYFKILSPEGIPDFLLDYIETPEMQKQGGVSVSCGTIYSKMFHHRFWYSSLDHSVGVALIVWNFTKDKKQTLAGLFHDIATPVFKHSIDFMNGDYETQESTEELTTKMISESKEIMSLLNRDGIKIEEVADYHIYPIADNNTPQLSADRLEYTFSNGLGAGDKALWGLEEVKEIYQNIEVQKNEDNIEELGFEDKEVAEKFVHVMSKLSSSYIQNKTKFSMQFLADIMKKMSEKNLISKRDLYSLSEKEVIEKIENCELDNISENFNFWKNATEIKESDTSIAGKYGVSIKAKIRYIVPLVRVQDEFIRINRISKEASQDIEKALNFKTRKYAYLDFEF